MRRAALRPRGSSARAEGRGGAERGAGPDGWEAGAGRQPAALCARRRGERLTSSDVLEAAGGGTVTRWQLGASRAAGAKERPSAMIPLERPSSGGSSPAAAPGSGRVGRGLTTPRRLPPPPRGLLTEIRTAVCTEPFQDAYSLSPGRALGR